MKGEVVKTYPGVDDGQWLDVVRAPGGGYEVWAAEQDICITGLFTQQRGAEEYVVQLQDQQRETWLLSRTLQQLQAP